MSGSFKLTLPLIVILPRVKVADKIFILNLNNYRNTHHMTLNQAKVKYKEMVYGAMLTDSGKYIPPAIGLPPYLFTYTVFPGSMRTFDVNNVCSIIDKFAADALQELGVIKNDNFKFIPRSVFEYGSVDKDNPRCELVITSIQKELT